MSAKYRTDFHALADGERVTLHPSERNRLHRKPVTATHSNGFFYCDGTPLELGPDYYFGDVHEMLHGYTREQA